MSQERVHMRKTMELLRLTKGSELSINQAARVCHIGRSTAQSYMERFEKSGITWPLPEGMTSDELEHQLFRSVEREGAEKRFPLDLKYLAEEMRRPNVTLALLWEEYKQSHVDGYQYSQFCVRYRGYMKTVNYSMRMEHKAGEKGFVDFGEGLKIVNPETGELTNTSLFVFCWGASNYLFTKATRGEDLPSWIKVNIDALTFFGCAPKVIVPDNLKSAVTKACRYEPETNPTYADFASHYGIVVMPTRPAAPKDKGKVEAGVKFAKRWILAKLRNRIFTSVEEINIAIPELQDLFNNKVMKSFGKSRKALFESLDKPNAIVLPALPYEFAEWKVATVNINYHIEYAGHSYSVPYQTIHQRVEVRATASVVEAFLKGKTLCCHRRSYVQNGYTTVKEHMPTAHQKYLEWSPERILNWAEQLGVSVREMAQKIIDDRAFPEQAYRSCLGLIRLEKTYTRERLNRACARAILHRNFRYTAVKSILAKGLDKQPTERITLQPKPIEHENIRGAKYYEPPQDPLLGAIKTTFNAVMRMGTTLL